MTSKKRKLKKTLSLLDVFCIASGAMISSGLFILPGIASSEVGPALFLSYIIASLFTIPTVLSMSELVTAMPKAGGDYFFITRSMGFAAGTIGGVATWFSLSLKGAFALIGMGAYVSLIPVFRNIPIEFLAVSFCLLFMLINIKGTKHAGRFQVGIVLVLIAILLVYIIRGFSAINLNSFTPFTPYGTMSVFTAAGFIFVSYAGLTKIASVAEEVKRPSRNIPLGMILSLIIVGLIYSLVVFITSGLLEGNVLAGSLTPIADAARVSMPTSGVVLLAAAAILAFVSTANAGILSASRYPLAMSRDKLLPKFLSRVHKKTKTPRFSIFITSGFMILAILLLPLKLLVEAASVCLILIFSLINVALIIMRESKMPNYRPTFRCPLYPGMQILGVLACLFLLYEMGTEALFMALIFVVASFLWYLVYGRLRTQRDSAVVHIVERLFSGGKADDTLRRELKNIIRERDEISEDRFDKIIKAAQIVDIDKEMSMEDFFRLSADKLAAKLSSDKDLLYKLLIEREKDSSTVIRSGLAIPHIVTEGEDEFHVLLARSKEGIKFKDAADPVKTVFVLVGSKDERNFHLRALSAIAQIVQEQDFEKNWLSAKNKEELRDIILLAERKRF